MDVYCDLSAGTGEETVFPTPRFVIDCEKLGGAFEFKFTLIDFGISYFEVVLGVSDYAEEPFNSLNDFFVFFFLTFLEAELFLTIVV